MGQTKAFVEACEAQAPGRIQLIEEPFRDFRASGAEELARKSSIPFFADESFQNKDDLKLLRQVFGGINIKLDKCGGLTPAKELIALAKSEHYQVQLGCMSGSGIGLAPAVHLSGAVDVVDLDSVLMIQGEEAHGVHYREEVARI